MSEVDDFFHRHLDGLAEAMKEPEVVHSKHCTNGKRLWIFTWRWPFVITWISNAICCCEINAILRDVKKPKHHIDDIVEILDGLRD